MLYASSRLRTLSEFSPKWSQKLLLNETALILFFEIKVEIFNTNSILFFFKKKRLQGNIANTSIDFKPKTKIRKKNHNYKGQK